LGSCRRNREPDGGRGFRSVGLRRKESRGKGGERGGGKGKWLDKAKLMVGGEWGGEGSREGQKFGRPKKKEKIDSFDDASYNC